MIHFYLNLIFELQVSTRTFIIHINYVLMNVPIHVRDNNSTYIITNLQLRQTLTRYF